MTFKQVAPSSAINRVAIAINDFPLSHTESVKAELLREVPIVVSFVVMPMKRFVDPQSASKIVNDTETKPVC